jgi:exo-1,4-beta-D-glucosaminidase
MKNFLIFLFLLIIYTYTTYSQRNILHNVIVLHKGWFIQSTGKVLGDGAAISTPKYSVKGWFSAEVPSTVMGTLVNDKVYQNVFVGDNLKNIPAEQFEKPWWYRTKFTFPKKEILKSIKLEFDGIIYRANIWLNGKQIANADRTAGVFRRFIFDISNVAKSGAKNILAVEVFPPKPGEPSVGFADWNPAAPDNNMGIWRAVKIKFSGDVSINNPFVQSKIDLETFKSAALTISAELKNNTSKKISGILTGKISKINFSKKITLEPNQNSLVIFTPQDFNQLNIKNPKLWWTYNLGKPSLYNLKLTFNINGKISDIDEVKFGIREVSDYINLKGYRGFKLNGRIIQIRGGGWTDNLFLNNSYENIKTQIDYVKQMGLNAIRLEGIWGENSDLYNLCDKKGILIMVGWSCQWENDEFFGKHVDEFGGIKSPDDMSLIAQSWEDQIKWLRNHPSIFVWLYGSDRIPRPELEKEYQVILRKDDPTRPFLASAGEHESTITGKTAVKMRGPYDYVPPVYWWIDKNKGGAFGFNTEEGPGAEVPPIESIKKMIPKNDLWPIDSVWNFHCAKNTFGNLNDYNDAMDNRLGTPRNLDDYCSKAQYLNYENTRAMFEANVANKYNATGVIHWMLNAAWPKLWWQLYDYYLLPGGAFYGTKKACEPVHILYNYGDSGIVAVNNTLKHQNNLKAEVQVLNFNLKQKYLKEIYVNLPSDKSVEILKLPLINNLSETYFIELKLFRGEEIVSSNFYCLSTKPDVLDTAKTTWYVTPTKEYSDLKELNELKKVHLTVTSKIIGLKGKCKVETELFNNTNELAFQIVLSVQKGRNGESVIPIFWDDNYFSLLPGEKRIIKGYFYKEDLKEKQPIIRVTGWNIN